MPTPRPTSRARLREHAPLAGASVVITRPSGSAQTLKRRVAALGGAPIGLPASILHGASDKAAVARELRAARAADVVVFVSPAAVKFALASEPGLRFGRSTIVCCVGAATARALRRRGIAHVLHPAARQDSEGVLALPQLAQVRGRRAVLIGAPGGRDLLATTLRARGARVGAVHVYSRAAPRFTARQLAAVAQARPPLITLLSSAEALDNLRAALPLELYGRLVAGELVVSSERLATAARAALFGNVHVAASALPSDLVAAAQIALARHRL